MSVTSVGSGVGGQPAVSIPCDALLWFIHGDPSRDDADPIAKRPPMRGQIASGEGNPPKGEKVLFIDGHVQRMTEPFDPYHWLQLNW